MVNPDLFYLRHQHTIAAPLAFVGIGLHSGKRVSMRIHPARTDQGITIFRRDLPTSEANFRISWNQVANSEMCTTICNAFGHEVATVEHLLSALQGLGISNARIELDGPEIPVMDGSAAPFVAALLNASVKQLDATREVIVIRRPVRLQQGESWAELLPDSLQRITVSIDFNQQDIGTQSLSFCLSPTTYKREIAPARTFGFAEQLWQLRHNGLARGGSIRNAVLLQAGRVANREGLRFRDEFVRHKALDVIGDLALVGAPIIGHYRGNRPGHKLNVGLLQLLMADPDAWVRVPAQDAERLTAGHMSISAGRGRQQLSIGAGEATRQRPQRSERSPVGARILRLFNNPRKSS